mgnify:CR=1 FL=1
MCSIEKSWIETLKPECNKEGVLFPYGGYKTLKEKNKELGLSDIMAKKKSYSDYEIDGLLRSNPLIKEYSIIVLEDIIQKEKQYYRKDKIPSNAYIRRKINKELELIFGKLNDFNEKQYFNEQTGDFQQKVWIVRNKETKELRFPTQKEKLYGFKKGEDEELRQGRILFYNRNKEELYEYMTFIYNKQIACYKILDKDEFLDYSIWVSFILDSIAEIIKIDNPQRLYFPLKMANISGGDNTKGVYYVDTLIEWYQKRLDNK